MSGFYSESNKRGLKTLIWQHGRNRSSKGKMLELLQSNVLSYKVSTCCFSACLLSRKDPFHHAEGNRMYT